MVVEDDVAIPDVQVEEGAHVPVPIKGEADILELIKQENSWEQILYDVVAIENLDPWNLDLNQLSRGFTGYISAIKVLDFRIPAKWVIIASMILRMKSDCIRILKTDEPDGEELPGMDDLGGEPDAADGGLELDAPELNPLEALPRRRPVRSITITELVGSLRRVISAQTRRDERLETRRGKVRIASEDIAARIDSLYRRITSMILNIRKEEVKFSEVVGTWKRDMVVDAFLPLVHLDQERKVACRQDAFFDEIFIKRR